ncbi:MAG: UbiX family flavin prenyltransferase [Candidatus Thorarchaeota archaeon]|jgi:polyprenyl P-hydroxybenzoate/phenylacrylic acid decarboxylase-like protein
MSKKILVCITGASGAIYGVQLVRQLKALDHEVHLVVSKWGEATLKHETGMSAEDLGKEVHKTYQEDELASGPASGSFPLDGIAIVPCSMKTLAGIAHGYADNLVVRAADCALKERRKLVIVPRETPMNLIHIRNMAAVTEAGAVVMPASPAFWHRPEKVNDLVSSFVERIMVHLGALEKPSIEWTGD